MDLLEDPWIPCRADNGAGELKLLTYRQLLCEPWCAWRVSLSRDDLEMACLQLLVCMTQVMFLPKDDAELRRRVSAPLTAEEFDAGVAPCRDWFDLDHPTRPFMQTRGVRAEKYTPIQKLLIGLPEGNNHAFFNDVGEVRKLSAPLTALALFNQASNGCSIGCGFKGNLRGGTNPFLTPVNIFVAGRDLRDTVWHNVLTEGMVRELLPDWERWGNNDLPVWVRPIAENETVSSSDIGLCRGLFWQPAKLELVHDALPDSCDLLDGFSGQVYRSLKKERFRFSVTGLWPHPHGARIALDVKDGKLVYRYSSFRAGVPAWTRLSEFVVMRGRDDPDAESGSVPSGPVLQAEQMGGGRLHLLVGGYCSRQSAIIGRRHEMLVLAKGWKDDKKRLSKLVNIGKTAKDTLYGKLRLVSKGCRKQRMVLKGVGVPIHEIADKLFYARTENLIHETFSNEATFLEWGTKRREYVDSIARHCSDIFDELTRPYAVKPELVPVIAWSRRRLIADIVKLKEES